MEPADREDTSAPAEHKGLRAVLVAGGLCIVVVTIWFLYKVFTGTP